MLTNPAVQERTKLIVDYLRKLELISKKDEREFLSDPFVPDAAERNLQLVIEAIAGVGNFVIRRKSYATPRSYQDIFETLCDHEVLPSDMKDTLIQMARFRNLLVHGYARIDKKRIYSILRTKLEELRHVTDILIRVALAMNS